MMVHKTERGWAGHYTLADRCMFRRNTLLECGDTKIVVSTVGNCRDFHAPDAWNTPTIQEIGHNRYFETMVFHAKENDEWNDADVSSPISTELWWSIEAPWREDQANGMHENMVQFISDNIRTNSKYYETFKSRTDAVDS